MMDKAAPLVPFKPRVLVVDDEKRIRDGCQKTLTLDGFDVTTAESGNQGLDLLAKEHFDIVLLDLMMPGLSGIEVLAKVKSLHADTVVIVITGYATLEYAVEAMKKGAFDFISKPFSPQELREVVSKAIEYTRTLQDIVTEKSRMRALINHLAGGVMATDAEKAVALANPAFLKMMGYRGDGIGRPVTDIVKNDQLNEMIDNALAMTANDAAALTAELSIAEKGQKEESILSVRCVPLRDRAGRNLGTITVLHDITALKKMDQLKSDFVSMVAHEIRSPMNTVLAQHKVILDGLAGPVTEKQREILAKASQKINNLAKLASELLDLARIESGLITQEREQLHLTGILTEQVAFHRAAAEAKTLQLLLEPVPDLPPVWANKDNIEEVLSNLITNAINYTAEGGEIRVSAGKRTRYVRLSVEDTGIGIAAKDLDRVFDRFYRVQDTRTKFVTGTGLGLAIVKSIVEAHDGLIRVESTPGRGSTFQVYLPVVQ